jgi:hypothetical protein
MFDIDCIPGLGSDEPLRKPISEAKLRANREN